MGRIHQMEQGQYAPGGFLGVYTDDWSDDTNRALFRDDTPTDAAAFHPYTHQSGLQGWLFGRVNRLLRHRLPDGLAREAALYWLNSTLFYAAELLVALAVWEEFGPLAAAFGFASVLLAPWLQRGMKDLYWCLWTWLLPLLAALWLCHCTRVRGKTPRGCWPLVAAACMVRCMCGFEFITTFLILCEIPLCYAAAKAYFVRRDPHGALVWLGRTVGAGVSALGGVTAALALWFAQEWLCFGSAADAWQNMTRAVTDRVSLTDGAVRDVNVPQVLAQYFRESTEPLLQLGPVSVTAWQLLLFALHPQESNSMPIRRKASIRFILIQIPPFGSDRSGEHNVPAWWCLCHIGLPFGDSGSRMPCTYCSVFLSRQEFLPSAECSRWCRPFRIDRSGCSSPLHKKALFSALYETQD